MVSNRIFYNYIKTSNEGYNTLHLVLIFCDQQLYKIAITWQYYILFRRYAEHFSKTVNSSRRETNFIPLCWLPNSERHLK